MRSKGQPLRQNSSAAAAVEAGQPGVVEEERHAVAMDSPMEAVQLDLSFASALGELGSRRDLK